MSISSIILSMKQVLITDYTTKTPLQLMGFMAGICWNGDADEKSNIKRALSCIKSNHGRVLEFPEVYLVLEGWSAKCLRELYTHIGGSPTRLQASTRYIDYSESFENLVPKTIENNDEATVIWDRAMKETTQHMRELKDLKVAKEDYTNLLPLSYSSKMVWKVNLRTLVNFMNKRLCNRAYHEIRELANQLKDKLSKYSAEWNQIVEMLFVPQCEVYKHVNEKLVFCPEVKGCKRHRNIKDLKMMLYEPEE